MTERLLLTFNPGSSTVKIGIFSIADDQPVRIGKVTVDFSDHPLRMHLLEGPKKLDLRLNAARSDDLSELLDEVFEELGKHFNLEAVVAAGHRIVHGGEVFSHAVSLTDGILAQVESLVPLAPLHQPQALRLIHAIKKLRPHLLQTGSFDTTFHATQQEVVRRLAIPRCFHEKGVKRYGFHGLSYAYITRALAREAPEIAQSKLIIAHLGSGASLCAVEKGESRDTSMGFSALDGIPMATRPGWLDPGVLLHFLGPLGMSVNEVEDMLYHRCGLLGVSGLSGDIRELAAKEEEHAREAIELFTFRIAGEIGRLASTLEGLDALVFTAGIGEHQPEIRANIVKRLSWLGADLEEAANRANAGKISSSTSRIAIHVIPTDEEQMIAEECLSVLSKASEPEGR